MDKKRCLIAAAEIRKLAITAMESAGFGHIGGSMSICDALAVLYGEVMNIDPRNPEKEDRDRLVLSKGHCGPALYATLAYKGYFPQSELLTLNANGTRLPSHCDRLKTVGIDISTGSLGQGLSLASGVAVGCKMKGLNNYTYVIVGDGELQEGQNWEAVQFIAHRCLSNLIILVDNNKRQLDGYTEQVCRQFDIRAKFEAFGLFAAEVDGHDVEAVYNGISQAINSNMPSVVILNTEKGHGCCFAEIPGFNHYMVFDSEQADTARREIDRRLEVSLKDALR
jgi:transketolase